VNEDGDCTVTRARREPLSRKPSSLRRESALSLLAAVEDAAASASPQPAEQSASTDGASELSPKSGSSDGGATPTSGVTSISTRSAAALDSDEEFLSRAVDGVTLDQVGVAVPTTTSTSTSGTKRRQQTQQAPRRATPFEVPSLLSGILSFAPIAGAQKVGLPPNAGGKAAVAADAASPWNAADDTLDIGSSVQTVDSSGSTVTPSLSEPRFEEEDGAQTATGPVSTTPAPVPTLGASRNAAALPAAPPTTPSTTTTTTTSTVSTAAVPAVATAAAGGPSGRPAVKNARLRALAAESENLPSPKQPKSPAPGGAPGTPVNAFGSGAGLVGTPGTPGAPKAAVAAAVAAAASGALSPCDSPSLPSALLGQRAGTGAFTRRVFRSQSNVAMT
jgi:hypothetical protein